MSTREISMGATRPIPRASHGHGTQPDWEFKTYASSAFDEPIDAADPTVIQRMSVILQIHLFFAVTACAVMGAGYLIFCVGA